MKRFLNILALAAVVTLTSCDYEPEGWHGTILDVKPSEVVFDTSSIDYMFTPEEGTVIEIPVSRGIATEAYTTTIEVLDGEGNPIIGNPDYTLMVLEQAKFEVDQYEAVATLSFDRRQFTAGKKVPFYLVLPDTQIIDDTTVCGLSILRDYTWQEYCSATLVSEFYNAFKGIPEVPCTVLKAEGLPCYRVINNMTESIDIEFSLEDGELGFLSEPDKDGDILFQTGLLYQPGYPIVRYVNVNPSATLYSPAYNALVAYALIYVPGAGSFGYFNDIWYFDKPL